jgi:anti-sigma factor RsiW
MKCSPHDLKDYVLGELSEEDRRVVEEHAGRCADCREELDRLSLTQAALHALRDEEIPRRIAFVSDKVFEPRWWQRLWASGPKLGLASASLLAAAILAHGVMVRPKATTPTGPSAQAIEAQVARRVQADVESAVQKAVAAAQADQTKKTAELVAAAEQKMEFQRRADAVTFEENLKYLQKQVNVRYMASAEMGGVR